MDKMKLAHEMALELVKIKPGLSAWQIADRCFEYADAMREELEKREPEPKGLSAIVKGFNNAAQENLAEQDAQMYGIGLIRILKKGDQLEYMRLDPKDVELNYRDTLSPEVTHLNNTLAAQKMVHDDEFQFTGYETPSTEWQPDWSQAPKWANWWAVDEDNNANWYKRKPSIDDTEFYSWKYSEAPLFGYQGDWRDSLRSRP